MIIGKQWGEMSKLDKILYRIESSEFKFRLTGSRFFGGAKEGSDYDFYVESGSDVESFLKNLGFVDLGKEHPYHKGDKLLDKLFELQLWSNDYAYDQGCEPDIVIHVQLIPPDRIQLKDKIQNAIRESGIAGSLQSKVDRKALWKLATSLATGE